MSKRMLQLGLFCLFLFALISVGSAQTWSDQQSGTAGHFSCVQFINDQIGYASGTDGIVLKTTNGGTTWVRQTTGNTGSFSDHYFVDANNGWAVGQGGVIKKTTDGGTTWSSQNSGTTSWLYFVQFLNSQTGYAAGVGGTILKTTNGGTSWSAQSVGSTKIIEGGFFTSTTDGYLCGEDGSIWKTTNGGTTWSLQTLSPATLLNGMWFANSTTGWAVGENGRAVKTTNSGTTWVDQTVGTAQGLNEVSFSTSDTGWVVGNAGVLYGTVNGGSTWQQNFSSSSQNLRSVFALDGRHAWAVGLNNTILKYDAPHQVPIQLASFNASVSNNHDVRLAWRTISEVNNYGFEVQRAFGEAEGFESIDGSFVPGHGTTNQPQNYSWTDNNAPSGHLYYRLKQIDLDGTTSYTEPVSVDVLTAVGEAGVATAYSLNQNYPNPFNPVTTIQFSIASAQLTNLKVYDMLGREVATLVNEMKQSGTYRVQWDANNFPSGMYFYKLTTQRFSETKKLTLVK